MQYLSKTQWNMLERSAREPVSVSENMNALASLYARSLVKFVGVSSARAVVPTKFGDTYIHLRKRLLKQLSQLFLT